MNVRSKILDILNSKDQLGELLFKVHEEKLYRPYSTFAEYVDKELHKSLRWALYRIAVYRTFSENVKISWTKKLILLPVITRKNEDYLLKLARISSVRGLKEKLHEYQRDREN